MIREADQGKARINIYSYFKPKRRKHQIALEQVVTWAIKQCCPEHYNALKNHKTKTRTICIKFSFISICTSIFPHFHVPYKIRL